MEDLFGNYIRAFIEFRENDELTDIFDDDMISLYTEEDIDMNQSKTYEFLTVISLKDNPTLNLSVAQPCKYKREESYIGTGILAYGTNARDILKRNIKPNEKIIKISINVDKNNVLNLCSYRSKEYLRKVYKTAGNKEFKSDKEFLNYVYKKGTKKIDLVYSILPLGQPIFPDSTIVDYMDKGGLILNEDIIQSAEEV